MRLDKLFITLLDTFLKFTTGASVGLLSMALVDRILCPGIFLDSPLIVLGWIILTGSLGTIILRGAYDA
jgi:hypothetical protein